MNWQRNGYFGWIDKTPSGDEILILSCHSRVKLAKENIERIKSS